MRLTRILIAILAVTSLALTPTPTPAISLDGLPPEIASLISGLDGRKAESLTGQPERLRWLGAWYEALKVAVPDLMPVAMDDFMRPDDSTMVVFESASMPGVVVVPPLGTWADMKAPPKNPLTRKDVEGTPGMVINRKAGEGLFKELQIPADAVLSQRDGRFVYVDAEGCVIGKVDNETGKWELAMRIDKEGYLHLEDHILRLHSTKQYAEGERIYNSPIINKIDIKYQEQFEELPIGYKYFEVTYDVLNGSKGLEKYWKLDGFHSKLKGSSINGKLTDLKGAVVTSEDNEKTKDPIDFMSIISGAPGTVTGIDITKNGVKMVVYDEEDMKYLAPPVVQ